MIELLKLCGFEDNELETELPRVEKVFRRLGITDEDIERGKQRLAKYYDIELKGLRKVFRLIMLELVDGLLAKEGGKKKVIYGFMAPGIAILGSALVSKSKEVLSIHQSWAFQVVVGCIFDKIVPVMEAAEKKWLKAGVVSHCANIKTLVGPIALGLFPKPDLLVTSGFTCEASPKTLDLLHEFYDIPVWHLETNLDRQSWEYPEPPMRIADLTAKSMRKLVRRIQEVVGFEITDDMVREVMAAKGKLEDALRRVRDLVENSDPMPLSPSHENIWYCLDELTLTIDGIAEATGAIDTLYEELKERVARGEGVVEKGAPRVLAILPGGQTDPRMDYLACKAGIAIVAVDFNLGAPFKEASEDPYVMFGLGSQQFTLGLTLLGRIPLIIEACKNLKIEGVLDRYHAGCRTTVADALIIEDAVKKELGIPVLVLEWESFDPRVYNHEQFKNKFEVFKTMMLGRRV